MNTDLTLNLSRKSALSAKSASLFLRFCSCAAAVFKKVSRLQVDMRVFLILNVRFVGFVVKRFWQRTVCALLNQAARQARKPHQKAAFEMIFTCLRKFSFP
jgi:hypothetical protein